MDLTALEHPANPCAMGGGGGTGRRYAGTTSGGLRLPPRRIWSSVRSMASDPRERPTAATSTVLKPRRNAAGPMPGFTKRIRSRRPHSMACSLWLSAAFSPRPTVGSLYKHYSPSPISTSNELHLGEISLDAHVPGSATALGRHNSYCR